MMSKKIEYEIDITNNRHCGVPKEADFFTYSKDEVIFLYEDDDTDKE